MSFRFLCPANLIIKGLEPVSRERHLPIAYKMVCL